MKIVEKIAEGQVSVLVASGLRAVQAANQDSANLGARQRLNQNLLAACERPVLRNVVAALWAGADPACFNEEGLSPLHLCASHGQADMAQLLIERGANPSSLCARGKTPANLASEAGHESLAAMLVGAQERMARSAVHVAADRDDKLKRSAQSALRLVQASSLRASFPQCRIAR